MADTYSFCLVGMMDQLWFHHPIRFTETINPLLSNPNILVDTPQDPGSDSFVDSTSEKSTLEDESDSIVKEENRGRDHSRSHSLSRRSTNRTMKTPSGSKALQKCRSCRSFEHLEMEEVKGLMDLGFIFRKEHLSPKMMSLVPGLQRLHELYKNQEEEQELSSEEEEEKMKCIVRRPYLSEAWLIRSPDSLLPNLQAPKAEIKQHLKSWAKSVAAVVEQET